MRILTKRAGQDNVDYIMQFNEIKYTEMLANLWQRGTYFVYAQISVNFTPSITKNSLKNDYRPILRATHVPLELF